MNFQFENPLEDSSISTINEDSFEEMPMKASVAMFQMNSILGDMDGNKDKILSFCLSHKDCDIVMTPELSLCGYPPEDLIFHKSFLSSCLSCAQELIKASKQFPNTYLLIGLPVREEDKVFNEAFLIKDGQLLGRYKKHICPITEFLTKEGILLPVKMTNPWSLKLREPNSVSISVRIFGIPRLRGLQKKLELRFYLF